MTDLEFQESKKRFLKRYRKNVALINRLKNKIEIIDERMTSLRSPKLSDMPRGGTPVTIEDLIAEKLEIEQRIRRLEDKGRLIKVEILDKIDELDDTRHAEILESFFIECKDLETIADDNGYTLRHTIRLYSDAIRAMSVECQ